MGSKGGKAKQQIAAYQMSLHLGFCYSVDKLLELFVKEKSVWKGSQSTNTELTIDQQNLFGGPKKEGGLLGAVSVLQGRSDQVLPTHLTTRLGRTPSNCPGFRDILSLFFYGAPGQGFLWSHNYPYLHTVWAKVQRIFQSGWYPTKASIVNPGSNPSYDAVLLNPSRDFDAQNAAVYPESSVDAYTVSGFSPDDILRVSITQGTFRAWSRWSGYGSGSGEYAGSTGYPLWWCAVNIKTAEGAITQHFDISGMTEEEAFALNSSTVVELTGSTAYTLWLYDNILYNRGGLSLKIEQLRYSDGDRDMNPAHIIRECLTNTEWGMALPGSAIDDTSFTDAANVLYDEGFGLSLTWSGQSDVETFVNEILGHIDATYGTDPETGKFFIKLIRGGYDVGLLPELTEDNCRIIQFNRKGMGETTNEVVVTWTNPANEGEETVTVHDLANYSAQGVLISSSRNYYGIRSASLAIRVALRELNKASQPLATFEVEANRVAWRWKSGDVIKVTYPEYGLNGLPCRITNINYGKAGTMGIRITLIEDVFDMPADSYVVSDGSYWEPPTTSVPSLSQAKVITAPYFAVARSMGDSAASAIAYPEVFAMVLASGVGSFAEVYSPAVNALGDTEYAYTGAVPTIGYAQLAAGLVPEVTSSVAVSHLVGTNPAAGVMAIIGEPATGEICIVESGDATGMVLRRGMLDTTPRVWTSGTPIRFIEWDASLSDGVSNVAGSTVAYRVAPDGSSGEGYLAASVTFDARPYKPFRPANVKLNGVLWPVSVAGPDMSVTWAHRNRTLETSVPLTWDEASISAEAGTSYTLKIYSPSDDLLFTGTGITGTSQPLAFGADPLADLVTLQMDLTSTLSDAKGHSIWSTWGANVSGGFLNLNNASDYILFEGSESDLFPRAGPCCLELRITPGSIAADGAIYDARPDGVNGAYIFLHTTPGGGLALVVDGVFKITTSTGLLAVGVEAHVQLDRDGTGVWRIFVNGNPEGGTYTDTRDFAPTHNRPVIGANAASLPVTNLDAKLRYIRFTKASRNTSAFTPTVGFDDTGIPGDSFRLELESHRDGYTSHEKFVHEFDLSGYGLHYGKYYGGS